MSGILTPHRFTVVQYEELGRAGILTENDRVELLRGEIFEKTAIGPAHAACVKRLNRMFQQRLGTVATIAVQDPIRTADSEPEPDLAVLKLDKDFYAAGTPGSEDALLVVEVSDTTLEIDRTLKCELYAEAGIPEYWIVNLVEQCLEVHRRPSHTGVYENTQRLERTATVTPVHFPDQRLLVSEML
ncbi:MAG: Uma2 family endonuclease [Planctomycetes bacterium]|nr:Uma2 family endonuclease [Planctomycetota bacterium]